MGFTESNLPPVETSEVRRYDSRNDNFFESAYPEPLFNLADLNKIQSIHFFIVHS